MCRDWLAKNSEGQPQEFCPNTKFFEAVKTGSC
ncbi:hypothetical protein [Methyloceanibacter marginalis]